MGDCTFYLPGFHIMQVSFFCNIFSCTKLFLSAFQTLQFVGYQSMSTHTKCTQSSHTTIIIFLSFFVIMLIFHISFNCKMLSESQDLFCMMITPWELFPHIVSTIVNKSWNLLCIFLFLFQTLIKLIIIIVLFVICIFIIHYCTHSFTLSPAFTIQFHT